MWIFLTILIAVAVIGILAAQWDKFSRLLRMLMVGAIIAYVFTPLCGFLERKTPRIWAITVIVLSMLGLLALIVIFFIPRMVNEVMVLADRFPALMDSIRNVVGNIRTGMDTMGIPDGIQDSITSFIDTFQVKATIFFRNLLERSVTGVSSLPSRFYFLKDREYFSRVLANMIPLRPRKTVLRIASEINQILHRFIFGEVFTAAVVGALATIAYLIIGVPYAFILGFLAALFEFIPYFGPWLGAAPAAVIAYLAGPNKLLWTVVADVLIQQLENLFITPRILGEVVDLHPVYIILSLWAGGLFFGIIGMFLAVPVVLILRVIVKHIYLSIVALR